MAGPVRERLLDILRARIAEALAARAYGDAEIDRHFPGDKREAFDRWRGTHRKESRGLPSLEKLTDLAQWLQVSVDWLVGIDIWAPGLAGLSPEDAERYARVLAAAAAALAATREDFLPPDHRYLPGMEPWPEWDYQLVNALPGTTAVSRMVYAIEAWAQEGRAAPNSYAVIERPGLAGYCDSEPMVRLGPVRWFLGYLEARGPSVEEVWGVGDVMAELHDRMRSIDHWYDVPAILRPALGSDECEPGQAADGSARSDAPHEYASGLPSAMESLQGPAEGYSVLPGFPVDESHARPVRDLMAERDLYPIGLLTNELARLREAAGYQLAASESALANNEAIKSLVTDSRVQPPVALGEALWAANCIRFDGGGRSPLRNSPEFYLWMIERLRAAMAGEPEPEMPGALRSLVESRRRGA